MEQVEGGEAVKVVGGTKRRRGSERGGNGPVRSLLSHCLPPAPVMDEAEWLS